MSAQEAEIIAMPSGQGLLFALPKVDAGAITITSTRGILIPDDQFATLLQSPEGAVGRIVSFTGGTGEIVGFGYKEGRMTWNVVMRDLEIEL